VETRAVVDCRRANGSCDFTVGADRRTGDGVTGFPSHLWSRQSADIRSTDRLAYLDVHANAQCKYQTVGRIDSTDWRTGQPRTDVLVIVCTHIQVVYSGVNITYLSTCTTRLTTVVSDIYSMES
jgi:hypothetical protein